MLPAVDMSAGNEYVWQIVSNNPVVFDAFNLSNLFRFDASLEAIRQEKYIDTLNMTATYVLWALIVCIVVPITIKVQLQSRRMQIVTAENLFFHAFRGTSGCTCSWNGRNSRFSAFSRWCRYPS